MLRCLTAGETHGKCLTVIIEGMPSGVKIDIDDINKTLARRRHGCGRGGRMAIETDKAEILSGVRGGYTLGSPIAVKIENKDWKNWERIMNPLACAAEKCITAPRPGHADLTGGMKYDHRDLRNVLERASARETAARTAAGAVAMQLLKPFGIYAQTRCASIGGIYDKFTSLDDDFYKRAVESPVGFGDSESERQAIEYIDNAEKNGESVGGTIETVFKNIPPGLGSYVHYDRKLDAAIAAAAVSIQAIKGVEFGTGFYMSELPGSKVHDETEYGDNGFSRKSNNAGGIEGGMSNGEPIVVRAAMKPIPTLRKPLSTVNINTKKTVKASVERSDVCAVYACSVVLESAVGFEIAKAFIDKFGGDSIGDIKNAYDNYMLKIKNF